MSSSVRKTANRPVRASRTTGRFALRSVVYSLVAASVNLGLYAIGRGADAALRVDPGVGAANHLIVPWDVAWKTILPIMLGAGVLTFTAQRPPRWTATVMVAGAAVATVSIPFVLLGAHDLLTGLLLAGMHTVTGLGYTLLGANVRADLGRDSRTRAGTEDSGPAIGGAP